MSAADYMMEEMQEWGEDNNCDVNNYLEQLYWETCPTVQSECCGETINEFTQLLITSKIKDSICPGCGEACEFLIIKGPANRPISITIL